MREKAADVLRERDGLRRHNDVLAEALRAVTARASERADVAHSEERSYTDATCGSARMVATLVNPTRAHGGIALVETFYGVTRDVEALHLDTWRARVSRMIESGCSSAWVWAEASLIESLTREVSKRNDRAA